MGEERQRGGRGVDRVSIQEAARRLGISEGAVRKRVKRGALEHDKAPDGRVYVYLDASRQGVDDVQAAGVDPNSSALISHLEDEIAYLRDENRRKDEIIMQQALTMRQLTAGEPQEARESPTPPPEASEGASTTPVTVGTPAATQPPQDEPRRSWWRRWFGG
jgi:AcrR family transcriptional regulator